MRGAHYSACAGDISAILKDNASILKDNGSPAFLSAGPR
jgi:hypothetical protein